MITPVGRIEPSQISSLTHFTGQRADSVRALEVLFDLPDYVPVVDGDVVLLVGIVRKIIKFERRVLREPNRLPVSRALLIAASAE